MGLSDFASTASCDAEGCPGVLTIPRDRQGDPERALNWVHGQGGWVVRGEQILCDRHARST